MPDRPDPADRGPSRVDAWKRDDARPRAASPRGTADGAGDAPKSPEHAPDPALVARVRALMFEARELISQKLAAAEKGKSK